MAEKRITTAEALVQLRKDLIEGGFTVDVAENIATVAAHDLIQTEGLGVRA